MSSDVRWHIRDKLWPMPISIVQCCFTSTETVRLIRTESPGRPPRLSHSSRALNSTYIRRFFYNHLHCLCYHMRAQELCESRGGRPGLSVLTSLMISVDVMQQWTVLRHWSQCVPNMSTDIRGHEALHHHHLCVTRQRMTRGQLHSYFSFA